MQYHQKKKNDVLIFRVDEPRLDSNIASDFKTEMYRLVVNEKELKILIDLKRVEYADSSGLGALLFGHRQTKTNGGKLKLVNLNPKVLSLIKIAKLDMVLEGYDNEEEAIESFKENNG